jgi:hypothetical protein
VHIENSLYSDPQIYHHIFSAIRGILSYAPAPPTPFVLEGVKHKLIKWALIGVHPDQDRISLRLFDGEIAKFHGRLLMMEVSVLFPVFRFYYFIFWIILLFFFR